MTIQLKKSLHQSFFLKQEAQVTDEMINLYHQGIADNNLEDFAASIAPHHSDQFTIHFTHDIDWLNPWHPYSIIKSLRSIAGKQTWLSLKQLKHHDLFLNNIEKLLSIESRYNIRATYCIGATSGKQLGRYDIRYSLENKLAQELISLLQSQQQLIGLQSSYHAHRADTLVSQATLLANNTHKPIPAHRSHYLNAPPALLYPQLEEAGILYDFGYGSSRSVGFKNRFPGKFRPIDPQTGNVFNLTVIPLILMDNVFFYSSGQQVMEQFKRTLDQLQRYNGTACISFHPENMILKPKLYDYFEEIIHICKQAGANIATPLS